MSEPFFFSLTTAPTVGDLAALVDDAADAEEDQAEGRQQHDDDHLVELRLLMGP